MKKKSALNKFFREHIKLHSYDQRHKKRVEHILTSLEPTKGPLPQNIIKLCDEYANDVLGSRVYTYWLYAYSAMAGKFKEGWIPDNYYGRVVLNKIEGPYQELSSYKIMTDQLFNSDAFPDVAYYSHGYFYDSQRNQISPKQLVAQLFENHDRIVFKSDNSEQGKGILFFTSKTFNLKQVYQLGNGAFQSYIDQHPLFDSFITGSVSTIRMTTVIDNNGQPSLRAGYLRFARKEESHIIGESQIINPIDLETGELNAVSYLPSWESVSEHPDTGVKFKGQIPSFDKCKETVLMLHKAVPFVRCIGWDLIVDKNEKVQIMEWNSGHNGIRLSEAVFGPCFADLGWEKLWRE